MKLREHHKQTIDRLKAAYESRPEFPALIIGGSVTKGYAAENADVDFMLVATDEEYSRRFAKNDLQIFRTDLCDYPEGYVDGKIINRQFLVDLAERGNEPSRSAFTGAILAYSKLAGLQILLDKIIEYPEAERENRLRTFYCMAFMGNWLMQEAERHKNLYLTFRATSQLSLYACRLILAYNRILYPFHKWLVRAVAEAPEKPPQFMQNLNALLENPSMATANKLFQSIQNFRDWSMTDRQIYTWFMTEVEWSWMNGTTSMEDL